MRELFLIIHFIGLAMGLGTSFAFMFLGFAAAKLERSEAMTFQKRIFVLSKMGHIGLTLLVVSGLYLMTPYWKSLGNTPLLIAKLVLVLVLGALMGMISSRAKKAADSSDPAMYKQIESLGKGSMLVALSIVVLAVLVFH